MYRRKTTSCFGCTLMLFSIGLSIWFIGFELPRLANAQPPPDAPVPDRTLPQPLPSITGLKLLFSGKQEDIAANWEAKGMPAKWDFEDGAMIATKPDNISTKEKFSDFQLHVEFRVPYVPNAKGQSRGNSGVFLQGRYEVQ